MPKNAALGCAQIDRLDEFLDIKLNIAKRWNTFEDKTLFFLSLKYNKANYWLNTIILNSKKDRDKFLRETNSKNIMTRPIWTSCLS